MTLSQRTILVIVSTFIALLFILATTSDLILLSRYSALEKATMLSHTRHISNQIDDRLKRLALTAHNVAEELKNSTEIPSYSKRLFTSYFMNSQRLDFIAVYDADGRLAAVQGFDCENNVTCRVTDQQQKALAGLLPRIVSNTRDALQGVVEIAGSPVMVACNAVKDSNGARRATVVAGWCIDHTELENVFRATGASIQLYDLNSSLEPDVEKAVAATRDNGEIYAAVIDKQSIAGYAPIKDVFGQTSFIARTVEKRPLYEHGKVTIAYIIMALCLAGAVFCCVMLMFVRGTILKRLQLLTREVLQITETGDVSARVPLTHHQDELNSLAVSINSMLDSVKQAEADMRESEERYRMLFERAPDAIIIIGVEGKEAGRIMAANQVAADQHGYTLDELLQLKIHDLNTAETNKNVGDAMARISSGEWYTAELWHQKKDGTQFAIEVHAGLIKIGGKKYVLGFDRDITQRKISEETDQMHHEQIQELNELLSRKAIDLAAVNHELETFNYSVSHDMRSPLTRISGYCQLLLDDDTELDPRAREYVTRIYESGLWLNDMIDALLQLAQLTRVELVAGSVNLSDIAGSVLEELSLEFPDRVVRTRVEPDIIVAGDVRLLKLVMVNLLNNAWKYSLYSKDALIEFGVKQDETGPVYYVRDNGAGFNMKDAGKLFRIFTRLHDSNQFAGTGIGLATVQRIIFRHGGRIWAEAEPGNGATFYFTLGQS